MLDTSPAWESSEWDKHRLAREFPEYELLANVGDEIPKRARERWRSGASL